ncbi:hypothetical protein BV25DRAFT_1826148 [Artomyces pyxidatus]|uniref:Uncharacterized protein n=1 Tax=Artomyces pyxidatus TaxID=48021 RepID=A0ACB8T045_9AGAM|nr:hypothetical protein BV25DRAFT_1826148 [Artomyces pyxidatus]
MKSHARDNRNTSRCSMDGDALVSPFRFRVAAKPGVWKVAKVNAVPTSAPEITGYIVYHSSVSPIRVLSSARRTNCHSREPLVTYVNRYAWGADGADTGDYARTVADADPEEWDARWARKWRMYLDGVHMDKFHQDSAAWDRLARFGGGAMFFADAARAPEVLKMVARPSDLDVRMCKKKSSSLYSEDSNATMPSRPFGCHLVLPEGEGHEVGRLVYSAEKSARFPDDDELIAFWYDNRHWPYADDELLHDPILERV